MQAGERLGSRAAGAASWRPPRRTLLAAFAAALAFALSFPLSEDFVAGWPLAFVWPALLAVAAWTAPSVRSLLTAVFPAFYMAFLAHQWWMREVTELGMPILVAYLAAWVALHAVVIRVLAGWGGRTILPCALVLPITLVAVEFLRGDLVCSGYAWFFAAHPLVEWTGLAQVASVGGGWLLSAIAGVVAGAAFDACVSRGPRRLISPLVAMLVLGASLAFGASHRAALAAPSAPSAGAAPRRTATFLVVQTNLPMSNKMSWAAEDQVEDFVDFAKLTLEGVRDARQQSPGGPILAAVWPETMSPGLGLERETLKTLKDNRLFPDDRFDQGLRDLSDLAGTKLIVGSMAYTGLRLEGAKLAWDGKFNSAYLVGPDGSLGRTDKIFLTPFGETMPIISNWTWLEEQLLAVGASGMTFDLDAAERPHRFEIASEGRTVRVGVPICFEITSPWASRRIAFDDGARAADVLVNISNDGWFAASAAGRRQHLQVSQLRAVELATPVVRAANTGISAAISATGEVLARLPAVKAATLRATVDLPPDAAPISARVGDGVAWLSLLGTVSGLLWRSRRPGQAAPAGGG